MRRQMTKLMTLGKRLGLLLLDVFLWLSIPMTWVLAMAAMVKKSAYTTMFRNPAVTAQRLEEPLWKDC